MKKLSLSGILSLKSKGKRLQNNHNSILNPFSYLKRKGLQNNIGFTLVELIVVITILAILSTIGFVAYSGYLAGTRDTNRIAQLKSISDGLEMYRTKHDLPMPDDYVEVTASGETIAYQGYAGKNVLETIEYTSEGKDPKDGTYFSYYLTKDKKYFQMMAYLEEADNLQAFAPPSPPLKGGTIKVSAIDYTSRYPTVYGKKLGILTDENNTPIQELEDIKTNGLDVVNTDKEFIARFKDDEKIEGTGAVLAQVNPRYSCKRIKELKGGSQDGVYIINPTGDNPFKVYCDMTTDGGGWTYATMLADNTTKNLFKTANTNKITSLTENISTKGQISDIWKDEGNKDILLQCFTNDENFKSYEIPLIIYNYKKSDINNLEKDEKAGTIFSSENLNASYNGNKFNLEKNYGGSSANESMYLQELETSKYVFHMPYSTQIVKQNNSYKNSSVYYNGPEIRKGLDKDNYCVSAIR